MGNGAEKIGALMKVEVLVQTVSMPEEIASEPLPFEFIFGLGTEGLSPFEIALLGRKASDEIRIPVQPGDMTRVAAHLVVPLQEGFDPFRPFFLQVRVVRVRAARDREIVRAMAHGGDCDCGCCGFHG